MSRLLGLVVALGWLVTQTGWAQVQEGSASSQQALREREVATPEAYTERVKKEGPFLELSLRDAIRMALSNNLQLEIENYNEDMNRFRVLGTKGYYDPVLQVSFGWNSTKRPSTSILDAGARIPTSIFKRWTFSSSLRQNLAWGSTLDISFDSNRATTNSAFTFMNPQFGSNFAVTWVQPLWRGFRETQTERQLKIYNLDTRISDMQFRQRVSDVIEQVQRQYWELVYAIENYEARRRSLDLAVIQYRNNQKRVETGVMAPIEITSSRAEVATREQELIASEVQIINAQNGLKQLLAPDPKAPIWGMSLIPTEKPEVQDIRVTLDEAIQMALERRPELEQLRLELEKTAIDRKFYRKEGKPSVDLRLGITSTGTAGKVFGQQLIDADKDGVPEQVIPNVPLPEAPFYGDFGKSWSQTFGFDYVSWVAAIDVEIPLRNRSNEAQLAQTALTERQNLSRLKQQQQAIMVEVRNAFEEILTRKKALEAARVARELSEEQLAGETKRFEAGLSTNFEVLRYQRDLADAQVRELRAMVDYQIALAALQRAMFTIIDENDIVTARRETAASQ
ncbi:MAG: hypothetical protein Kow00109_17490 [Acidobacteriota bacterium]